MSKASHNIEDHGLCFGLAKNICKLDYNMIEKVSVVDFLQKIFSIHFNALPFLKNDKV